MILTHAWGNCDLLWPFEMFPCPVFQIRLARLPPFARVPTYVDLRPIHSEIKILERFWVEFLWLMTFACIVNA